MKGEFLDDVEFAVFNPSHALLEMPMTIPSILPIFTE